MSDKAADSSTDTDIALVIFCRRPVPGIGKRRIATTIGETATLELAQRLLDTVLEDAATWPGPIVIAPAGPEDARWAAGLLPGGARVIPQVSGNLGERINSVDVAVRALGHSTLVYVGSDAPVLTPDYYACARRALADADVVLGPADDGGVTLMGATCAWPNLASLPWSSASLGRALELLCIDHGLSIGFLEQRFDVDRVADLARLHAALATDHRPARLELRRWLHEDAAVSECCRRATA